MKSYMAITFHYVDDTTYEIQNGLLDFSPVTGRHTGVRLARMFIYILEKYEIDKDKVFTLTVDNASNNDSMINVLIDEGYLKNGEHHVRCFAHILNLAAQELLGFITDIIKQIRINNRFIRKSPQRLEQFELVCRANKQNFQKPQLD